MNNKKAQDSDQVTPKAVQLRVPVNIIIMKPATTNGCYPIGIGLGPASDPVEQLAGMYIVEDGKRVRRSPRLYKNRDT